MEAVLEHIPVAEALAGIGRFTAVVSPSAWDGIAVSLPRPVQVLSVDSLEEIALDRLVAANDVAGDTIVGVGGGRALDAAKYVALRQAKPLVLIPTALSTLAPFTTEAARRVRRQLLWAGEVEGRVIVDLDVLARAPLALNRAGAAWVTATATATWDWRFADAHDLGMPFSDAQADLGALCRQRLRDAAPEVRAASRDGLAELVELLSALGRATVRSGHRRLVEGSEQYFLQAYEHRLGRPADVGGFLGLCTVAMASLQQVFGAGPLAAVDEPVGLLAACGVASNPNQLGLDEGTFRGLLRHTVRFAVGEALPYSVLNEADVNTSTSEEMWRQVWRVPPVR